MSRVFLEKTKKNYPAKARRRKEKAKHSQAGLAIRGCWGDAEWGAGRVAKGVSGGVERGAEGC